MLQVTVAQVETSRGPLLTSSPPREGSIGLELISRDGMAEAVSFIPLLIFKNVFPFYLTGRETERQMERDLPPASLLPKCVQQPGVGQAEARSPELNPSL